MKFKYKIGSIVYLITDQSQCEMMVTAIHITHGDLMYELSCGSHSSTHYEFEMHDKKDCLKQMMLNE